MQDVMDAVDKLCSFLTWAAWFIVCGILATLAFYGML